MKENLINFLKERTTALTVNDINVMINIISQLEERKPEKEKPEEPKPEKRNK